MWIFSISKMAVILYGRSHIHRYFLVVSKPSKPTLFKPCSLKACRFPGEPNEGVWSQGPGRPGTETCADVEISTSSLCFYLIGLASVWDFILTKAPGNLNTPFSPYADPMFHTVSQLTCLPTVVSCSLTDPALGFWTSHPRSPLQLVLPGAPPHIHYLYSKLCFRICFWRNPT